MTKTGLITTIAAMALMPAAAHANSTADVRDLVGAQASSGASTLGARGYAQVQHRTDTNTSHGYWWNEASDNCIRVTSAGGRYSAIDEASDGDCNQGGGISTGEAVAAGTVVAAVIGGILLAHGDHDDDDELNYERLRGERASRADEELRSHGYREVYRANVGYDVATSYWQHDRDRRCLRMTVRDGRVQDLRDGSSDGRCTGTQPGWNDQSGWGQSSRWDDYDELEGDRLDTAERELTSRGFVALQTAPAWGRQPRDWYNTRSRQCLRLTVNDGRVRGVQDMGWNACRTGTGDQNWPGWDANQSPAYYGDLMNERTSEAADEMRERGFREVDRQSGNGNQFSYWYHAYTRQCVQMVANDGRVRDIRDIGAHPACR